MSKCFVLFVIDIPQSRRLNRFKQCLNQNDTFHRQVGDFTFERQNLHPNPSPAMLVTFVALASLEQNPVQGKTNENIMHIELQEKMSNVAIKQQNCPHVNVVTLVVPAGILAWCKQLKQTWPLQVKQGHH